MPEKLLLPDGNLQVAPDSTGKKVAMDKTLASDGSDIYVQKAEIVGDVANDIAEIKEIMKLQLAVFRGILFALTNGEITEETFKE
jgi:hypothetical protein